MYFICPISPAVMTLSTAPTTITTPTGSPRNTTSPAEQLAKSIKRYKSNYPTLSDECRWVVFNIEACTKASVYDCNQ